MKVRIGSIEEVYGLIPKVPELRQYYSLSYYETQLVGRRKLVLVAVESNQTLGFKVGYEVDRSAFYSWVGGVLPPFRRGGVAQALLEAQEAWVWSNSYHQLTVKTSAEFPAMQRFLERNSYDLYEVVGEELVYRKEQPNHGFNRTRESSGPAKPAWLIGRAGSPKR